MIVAKDITAITSLLKKEKLNYRKIALIPTMGSLHEGHLALIKEAKKLADIVVVSIFVNPSQFNDLNDYLKYPRQFENDLQKLENIQANYVFHPTDIQIYPLDFSYKIIPGKLDDCLCGTHRKGHFAGVSLIITKLFNIIQPDIAIFGQKDFQQLQIIKKLVKDLNFSVEIIGHPTLRQEDGLALSSRNQRLNSQNLIKAAEIYKILTQIRQTIIKEAKINQNFNFQNLLKEKSNQLISLGFEKIDYLEVREEETLKLIQEFKQNLKLRIFIAVYLQEIRLIDNLSI